MDAPFLVTFCRLVFLPLFSHAKLLALPGHMVVTQPEVSSIHSKQLVECSTSPLKNVAPRMSMLSLYVCDDKFHDIPASETTKHDRCLNP